mgnify:FL=1
MSGSRYVLTEFRTSDEKSYIRERVQALIRKGYYPIIAHVERYHSVVKNGLDFIDELRDMGAYIQMNADSIIGEDGFMIKRFCKKVIKEEMLDLKQLTGDVCRIATEAGHFLKEERKNFRRESVVEKHAHDYVSYVDKESEVRIVKALSALLPEAGFITEEGSATYQDEPYCWVIDPLDGTTNYIHDEAPYCVCIALRSRTELLLGVVYEVCRDECFCAWRGGRAFMNGEEIHVSGVRDIKDAFVFAELPYNAQQYKQTALHLIDKLYGVVGGIRMNGSAAAAICYVAMGRFDAWAEAFLGKWDYSAAALIVQEAGGRVTDFCGNGHFMDGHHIIATNGYLHSVYQQLIAEVPPLDM